MFDNQTPAAELALKIAHQFGRDDDPAELASLQYTPEAVELSVRLRSSKVIWSDNARCTEECWGLIRSRLSRPVEQITYALLLINVSTQTVTEVRVR